MDNNIVKLSPLKQGIERLQGAWLTMRSPAFLAALREVSESEASDLRRSILRVLAFLDDSISNPSLGSIFNRTTTDPLNDMADNIAAAYGVRKTYPGTTGTTGLNAPATMTLAGEGEWIAIGRDCHVSVVGGLYLSGARPVYLLPPFDPRFGVLLPPTPGEVAALLDEWPAVRALVVTMPTYHGLMGDVAGIVRECHLRGVVVMVDEAHGPHFHFLRGLGYPLAAEDAGADLVTQSTHKVLSALNQGSLLHFNNLGLARRYEECQAMGFQSTSFSYPVLLSIEHAVEQMVLDGERTWARAVDLAGRLHQGAARLHGVRVLDGSIVDGVRVVGLDPTRVTLNVRETGRTGYEVEERLLDRGFIVEMSTPDIVLFFVSPSVNEEQIEATVRALRDVLSTRVETKASEVFVPPALPESPLTPRQAAMCTTRERVPVADAVGRVSAETIGCYPPGQAIFVAGERITESGVAYLNRAVAAGGHLKRVQDDHFKTIEVVAASAREA